LQAILDSGAVQRGDVLLPPQAESSESTPTASAQTSAGRPYYAIRRSLKAMWPESSRMLGHYARAMASCESDRCAPLRRIAGDSAGDIVGIDPSRVVYMDIETCGLAGNMIFLIGWCRFTGDDVFIEQALAADYSQEMPMLHAFAERMIDTDALLTFNGKRFDFPTICERSILNGVRMPKPKIHLDMLDHARARWRKQLPNCKLQTLELHLCRRNRIGDVPGSVIPDVYHDFVRTGNARVLAAVIHHNLLDLVTLAEITAHLLIERPAADDIP
jgi:uncharacterized protein YprB with RNaseH-like and TPR domain